MTPYYNASFVEAIADGDHWPDSEWCRDHEAEWAAALNRDYRAALSGTQQGTR